MDGSEKSPVKNNRPKYDSWKFVEKHDPEIKKYIPKDPGMS